ncbi:MAG: hypothetical protein ABIO92_02135 [Chloroflexia bacterium]
MTKPIGILYEHPEWFTPLFTELDRRGLPYERILAHEHSFDPDSSACPYSLVVNRVSPSSYLRNHTSAIFYTHQYLAHLDKLVVPVVNGSAAYALETSKARQLSLLSALGVAHPRSVIVNSLNQILPAAARLEYPVIVKPNIGGSGALMQRFYSTSELQAAFDSGQLNGVLGLDYTAIVQEYHEPKGGAIVRVEALDGRFLYAIRIHSDPGSGFNLCPADICQIDDAPTVDTLVTADAVLDFCPVDAPTKKALKIEVAEPPSWVVDEALRVFEAGNIDVGGVEYLESKRDGGIYIYDINSLSNFVTDAPNLVGFDPFERFVDYLEKQLRRPEQSRHEHINTGVQL